MLEKPCGQHLHSAKINQFKYVNEDSFTLRSVSLSLSPSLSLSLSLTPSHSLSFLNIYFLSTTVGRRPWEWRSVDVLVDIVDVIPVSFLTVIDTLCWYILLLFSGEPCPPLSLPVEKQQPATAVPGTTQCCKRIRANFILTPRSSVSP